MCLGNNDCIINVTKRVCRIDTYHCVDARASDTRKERESQRRQLHPCIKRAKRDVKVTLNRVRRLYIVRSQARNSKRNSFGVY